MLRSASAKVHNVHYEKPRAAALHKGASRAGRTSDKPAGQRPQESGAGPRLKSRRRRPPRRLATVRGSTQGVVPPGAAVDRRAVRDRRARREQPVRDVPHPGADRQRRAAARRDRDRSQDHRLQARQALRDRDDPAAGPWPRASRASGPSVGRIRRATADRRHRRRTRRTSPSGRCAAAADDHDRQVPAGGRTPDRLLDRRRREVRAAPVRRDHRGRRADRGLRLARPPIPVRDGRRGTAPAEPPARRPVPLHSVARRRPHRTAQSWRRGAPPDRGADRVGPRHPFGLVQRPP